MMTCMRTLVIGGTALKFFDQLWMEVIGIIFMLAALATFIIGWRRYQRMAAYVGAALEQRVTDPVAKAKEAA